MHGRPRHGRVAWRRAAVVILLAASLSGGVAGPGSAAGSIALTDPTAPLDTAWKRRDFHAETRFSRAVVDGRPAIRARGRDSASLLYREIDLDPERFPVVRWHWRVDRLQPSADLRARESEDFAAAIFFLFGKPTLLDRQVPTLIYAWTATPVPPGTVIASPRFPERVRTIVLRQGSGDLGRWVEETRDLARDFERAFGRKPPEPARIVAIMSDSDQTMETVEAYYGPIHGQSK